MSPRKRQLREPAPKHKYTVDDPVEATRRWFHALQYMASDTWSPLPSWARFFLDLGSGLAALRHSDARFFCTVTVPTRSYASVLIAAGYIANRAVSGEATLEEHIAALRAAPRETALFLSVKKRKLRASLLGVVSWGGRDHFHITTAKGEERYVPLDQASTLEILERGTWSLPRQQTGREIEPPSPLLTTLIAEPDLTIFTNTSHHDCLLIGRRNELKAEAMSPSLGYDTGASSESLGTWQDILRTKDFPRPRSGYRSQVLARSAQGPPSNGEMPQPALVVFDGPGSFLRWREIWQSAHWVAVLDRRDPNFEDGCQAANEVYAQRLDTRLPRSPVNTIQPGVEVMLCTLRQ
jgi:hypothetical protein